MHLPAAVARLGLFGAFPIADEVALLVLLLLAPVAEPRLVVLPFLVAIVAEEYTPPLGAPG